MESVPTRRGIVEELKKWMDKISPDLRSNMSLILRGQGKKKGAIVLYGPPNTGKSILVKLFTAVYSPEEIGVLMRTTDDNRFAFQSLIGKECFVAEEYLLNELTADWFKMLLEGNPLFRAEKKGSGMFYIERKPMIISTNFPLTQLCPRQTPSVRERCFIYTLTDELKDDDIVTQVYSCTTNELIDIHECLFLK